MENSTVEKQTITEILGISEERKQALHEGLKIASKEFVSNDEITLVTEGLALVESNCQPENIKEAMYIGYAFAKILNKIEEDPLQRLFRMMK